MAQLDFYDFVTVAELSTDRVNAATPICSRSGRGNSAHGRPPDLRDGLFKLDLGHDRISMLQDRILIFDEDGEGFDAPGNIGTGKHTFAQLTVDARSAAYGTGFASGQRTDPTTRVEDPISGDRNFTGFYADWNGGSTCAATPGPWSYGFASTTGPFHLFRTDEFDIISTADPTEPRSSNTARTRALRSCSISTMP